MAPTAIIDSHVHLWPESAANSTGHGWMSDGFMLSKQHILEDYYRAATQKSEDGMIPQVRGVIYVETDRRLEEKSGRPLHEWAHQPTEEIKFLRSIVEKHYGEKDSKMLLGLVPWAPVNHGPNIFEEWMKHAEHTAGPETWGRIKGFRYLLQGITNQGEFEGLVFGDDFISILKSLRGNGRNFSFDVGVDQHSGGVWQLEALTKVIEQVHAGANEKDKVVFILSWSNDMLKDCQDGADRQLDHLCKPDMTQAPTTTADFERWCACMKRFSTFSNVYIKLSGAFSELSSDRVQTISADEIADKMKPWLDHLFSCFAPERIMFGSDWPVCNIRGPALEDSWPVWRQVVQIALQQRQFTEKEQERIWSGTAVEAYRLEL
ncbi:hypothetical protein MBLNU459_g3701t1 [Dothideomycetes sp. NU459]